MDDDMVTGLTFIDFKKALFDVINDELLLKKTVYLWSQRLHSQMVWVDHISQVGAKMLV